MWKIILIVLALLYVINPYDLLPDFIIGLGWLDDLVVLGLRGRYLYAIKKKRDAFQRFYQQDSHFHNNTRGDNFSKKKNFHSNESSALMDPYRVLGIGKNASAAEIKQAYRQLAIKYHPDKVEHLGEEFKLLAEKRFKEIQQAYQELKVK